LKSEISELREPDDIPTNMTTMQELVSVSFDAKEFPKLVSPTIEELVHKTVSGKAAEELVGALSDGIVQDALRAIGTELVNTYLESFGSKIHASASINDYVNKFMKSTAGQRLTAGFQGLRTYTASLVQRIRDYHRVGGDPLIAAVEQSNIDEIQDVLDRLSSYPRSDSSWSRSDPSRLFDPFSSGQLGGDPKTASEQAQRELAADLASSAMQSDRADVKLFDLLDRAKSPTNEHNKMEIQGELLDLARTYNGGNGTGTNLLLSGIVLCVCQLTVPPYSILYAFLTNVCIPRPGC
jgi:hypothetical protein